MTNEVEYLIETFLPEFAEKISVYPEEYRQEALAEIAYLRNCEIHEVDTFKPSELTEPCHKSKEYKEFSKKFDPECLLDDCVADFFKHLQKSGLAS